MTVLAIAGRRNGIGGGRGGGAAAIRTPAAPPTAGHRSDRIRPGRYVDVAANGRTVVRRGTSRHESAVSPGSPAIHVVAYGFLRSGSSRQPDLHTPPPRRAGATDVRRETGWRGDKPARRLRTARRAAPQPAMAVLDELSDAPFGRRVRKQSRRRDTLYGVTSSATGSDSGLGPVHDLVHSGDASQPCRHRKTACATTASDEKTARPSRAGDRSGDTCPGFNPLRISLPFDRPSLQVGELTQNWRIRDRSARRATGARP